MFCLYINTYNTIIYEIYRNNEEGARDALVTQPQSATIIDTAYKNVYNTTTIPITDADKSELTQLTQSSLAAEAAARAKNNTDFENGGENYVVNSVGEAEQQKQLSGGNYNELGIPRTPRASIHRWLPKQQWGILQKQADVLCNSQPANNNNINKKETQF